MVLPADLYVRTALSAAAADTAWFSPEFVQAVAGMDGVRRVAAQRTRSLLLDPALPPVALLARQIDDAAQIAAAGGRAVARRRRARSPST